MSLEEDYELEAAPFVSSSTVSVYRCRNRQTGAVCVAKVYKRNQITERKASNCVIEAHLGQSIPVHPNVVRVLGLYDEPEIIAVMMEHMGGGTLFQHLISRGRITEEKAGPLVYQILQGVAHLHEKRIMHRDLKPENIFFRSGAKDTVAIGDFGFATHEIPSDQYLGSPQYSPPEMAMIALQIHSAKKMKGLYNEKCDLWSVGVVTFVMLTGLLPFDGATPDAVFSCVVRNKIPFEKAEARSMSPMARQFITSLTASNPSKRPSAKEALRLPWMVAYR